jgi:uncharacterized protein (DUF58 family)
MSRWRQLRNFFARRVRYKVTRAGALFVFGVLLVGIAAAATANNLLFLIVAAMLATLLVSGFVSRMCLAGLELDFLVPDHVPAGRYVPAKLFVRNQKWLMPSFSIRVEAVGGEGAPSLRSGVYFPLIASGATLEANVAVRFPRRGTYRENGFAFSTSFPFGFLEKFARVTLRRETLVYPSLDPHPGFEDLLLGIAGEIETHYRGLGKDFYRIRPYDVLESARHIDWKASARVGSVQVREFAREQEQTVEIYLDRDVPYALDEWFERAVDCCAFLAWRLADRGVSVHFRSQGFDFRQPEDGDIYAILKYLALVYPLRSQSTAPPLEDSSYKIVVTPSPRRFTESGWVDARILAPEALPLSDGGPGVAA